MEDNLDNNGQTDLAQELTEAEVKLASAYVFDVQFFKREI